VLEAVLDTSILARGLRAGPETAVGFIMGSWTDGHFRVVVSQHILDELQRTLAKPPIRGLRLWIPALSLASCAPCLSRNELTEPNNNAPPDHEAARSVSRIGSMPIVTA